MYLSICICVFEFDGIWRDSESTIHVVSKHDENTKHGGMSAEASIDLFEWNFFPGEDMEPPGVEIKS